MDTLNQCIARFDQQFVWCDVVISFLVFVFRRNVLPLNYMEKNKTRFLFGWSTGTAGF